jgi:hypothetical protein
MKNLNLIFIAITFVLVMQVVSAETIPAGYGLYDNFNSGTIDSNKWLPSVTVGSTVYSPATEGNSYAGSSGDYALIDQISGGGFGGEIDVATISNGANANYLKSQIETKISPFPRYSYLQTKVQMVFNPNTIGRNYSSFLGFYNPSNKFYYGWHFDTKQISPTAGVEPLKDINWYGCTFGIAYNDICTFNFKLNYSTVVDYYGNHFDMTYLYTWATCTDSNGANTRYCGSETSPQFLEMWARWAGEDFPFNTVKFVFVNNIVAGHSAAVTNEFDVDYVAYKPDITTSISFNYVPKGPYSATNESVPFTLSCSGTGCTNSYYKSADFVSTQPHIDCNTGGYTQGTSGTLTCPAGSACTKEICYYSTDNLGNGNDHKVYDYILIDRVPPTLWITGGPTSWQKNGALISVGCNDWDSSCNSTSFKLKSYPSNPGTCPITESSYDKTSPATITDPWVCAFAKDYAGNIGTYLTQIKIDNTPPAVSVTGAPATWQKSATAGVSCTDAESGCSPSTNFKIALFASNPGACASLDAPIYLYLFGINKPITEHGWVCAKAQDNAGNVNYSVPVEFLVDSTSPTISITSPDPAIWQKTDFTLSYSVSDTGGSGVQSCNLSIRDGTGNNWVDKGTIPCSSSKTITVGTTGKYCSVPGLNSCGVRVWANDAAGNSAYTEINFSVLATTVSISSPNPGSPQNKTFNVTYTADSPRISVCKLSIRNGTGEWQDKGNISCGPDKQISITVGPGKNCSIEGTNTCGVRIWANDTTGASNQSEINLTIDYTNPSVIISSPGAGSGQNNNFSINYSASDNFALSACNLFIRNGTAALWQNKGNINCFANQVNITVGVGKNCTIEGIDACGARILAIDIAGNLNQSERNFSIDFTIPSVMIIPKGADWTKSNISFNVSCYDIQNCTKVNYSYFNFSKFVFSREIAGNSKSLNISGNATCNSGNACRVLLGAAAVDTAGNMNTTTQSDLFLIDLQNPQIEKTECKFKATPASSPAICKSNIAVGSTVTLSVVANDSDGSGVENLKIYLIKDGVTSVPPTIVNNMPDKRKNATATIPINSMTNYDTIIEITDYAGNIINLSGTSFSIGGNSNQKCAEQGGKLCNFYQVCSGIPDDKPKDAKENLGITCCFGGECLNRSTLSTCKQQGGEIYDNNLSTCLGTPVPASDTIEKNRCCKGTLAAKTNSLAWYDMAGNKISGAARGDKVKCVGIANTDYPTAHFDIKITLGTIKLFDQQNIKVSSTTKANSSIILLNETGTYKCSAVLHTSSDTIIAPINLKVIEAPTKPRYTELPGFSSIAMLIAIVGLMIYYLARRK